LVFLSRYGKPWKSWRTAFENARERAGITDFKFHDLRHNAGFPIMPSPRQRVLAYRGLVSLQLGIIGYS